eukprot:scpid50032/ scgid2116/ Zinc finger FYVE domain-containing protein 16; Endofin; Endosome-associated FYVE domain protein
MGCCGSTESEDKVPSLHSFSSTGSGSSTRSSRRDYGSSRASSGSNISSAYRRVSREDGDGGSGNGGEGRQWRSRSLATGQSGSPSEADYSARPSASLSPSPSSSRPSNGAVHASTAALGPFENAPAFCPDKYWVKDEEAPTCGYCGDEFTLTNRRHHCRLCGDIFHGGECAQKAGQFEVWVCTFCFEYHTIYKGPMQSGCVMTKYTKDLERNHQRHFWLSSDGRELIWKEVESRSRLSNITGSTVHNLRLADVTRIQASGPPGLETGYGHCYAFQVITGERPFVLEAANVKDYNIWTEGLKCAVYVSQAHQNLQGRQLEDRARRHAKRSRDNHRQLIADRVRARQKRMKKSG